MIRKLTLLTVLSLVLSFTSTSFAGGPNPFAMRALMAKAAQNQKAAKQQPKRRARIDYRGNRYDLKKGKIYKNGKYHKDLKPKYPTIVYKGVTYYWINGKAVPQ